jgi:ribosomal-protein-alanine N-acetyltransferase
MRIVRRGEAGDLAAVAAIQQASPEAAQWDPADYLHRAFRVALRDGRVVGFLVARKVAEDECELLNLAVAPEFRRKGIARELVLALLADCRGAIYLEVRESNTAARKFYNSIGFAEVGTRNDYYHDPPETAIVMKVRSC